MDTNIHVYMFVEGNKHETEISATFMTIWFQIMGEPVLCKLQLGVSET